MNRIFLFVVVLFVPLITSRPQQLREQRGNASYYADSFHGRRMANGELYHRDSMTCAHLRYPLGTWLMVRNLTNGKEVAVEVTDRGPYSRKFVIDLSRAAARELDIIHYGWRPVEIIPFVPGKVPFKLERSNEKSEFDLGFSTDIFDAPPVWQDDSIYMEQHRLSRTAVVRAYRDSLASTLREDTTLREKAIKVVKPVHTFGAASGKNRKRR